MKPTTSISNPAVNALLLGMSTVIAQALLLREAMAAMGGSETAWGVVMALWLAGMAVGSRAGVRLFSPRFATTSPVLTLVLAGLGTILFRAAPAIIGAAPGETLTTLHAVWLWALAVVPAATAGGIAFPIVAGELGRSGPGRAYTLEATGALFGGVVFTFALIPMGSVAALLVTIGFVVGATLWPRQRVLASIIVVLCLVAAMPAGDYLAQRTWQWSGRPGQLDGWTETRHQRLESSAGAPTNLYSDSRLLASYPEPYSVLPRAHLMMLLHPAPRRVLSVGCAADGALEALVRHPVSELRLVEEDPRLFDHLRRWYGEQFRKLLADPKVAVLSTDPLQAIDRERDLDLIILTDGDPTTLRSNRTRTLEFLRRCRRAMKPDAMLIMRVGVTDTYLGGAAGDLLATLVSTLRRVFPTVAIIPGEEVLLVAGMDDADLDPTMDELVERLLDRPEVGEQLHPAMLPILVDEGRKSELQVFLESASAPENTLRRPRAVGYAVNLHEARSSLHRAARFSEIEGRGPTLLTWGLTIFTVLVLGAGFAPRRPIRAVAAAAVVGLTSMGWWLLLLATWQATRGSVYAEVGALTGVFMAGVAAGGWLGLRSTDPVKWLPRALGGGVTFSLLVASGVTIWAPTLLVPFFLAVGGGLTGAAFPGLGRLAGGDSVRRGAGIAFAADEIGAAVAALVIGTVAIPWVGMTAAALGLAVLGAAALPAVVRA